MPTDGRPPSDNRHVEGGLEKSLLFVNHGGAPVYLCTAVTSAEIGFSGDEPAGQTAVDE